MLLHSILDLFRGLCMRGMGGEGRRAAIGLAIVGTVGDTSFRARWFVLNWSNRAWVESKIRPNGRSIILEKI